MDPIANIVWPPHNDEEETFEVLGTRTPNHYKNKKHVSSVGKLLI
jgi:hypothetical protein